MLTPFPLFNRYERLGQLADIGSASDSDEQEGCHQLRGEDGQQMRWIEPISKPRARSQDVMIGSSDGRKLGEKLHSQSGPDTNWFSISAKDKFEEPSSEGRKKLCQSDPSNGSIGRKPGVGSDIVRTQAPSGLSSKAKKSRMNANRLNSTYAMEKVNGMIRTVKERKQNKKRSTSASTGNLPQLNHDYSEHEKGFPGELHSEYERSRSTDSIIRQSNTEQGLSPKTFRSSSLSPSSQSSSAKQRPRKHSLTKPKKSLSNVSFESRQDSPQPHQLRKTSRVRKTSLVSISNSPSYFYRQKIDPLLLMRQYSD